MSNPLTHKDDALRITEIFYSLQGEARTVGLATVFVRLTGCPLRCVYCDTEYAFSGGDLGCRRPSGAAFTGTAQSPIITVAAPAGGGPVGATDSMAALARRRLAVCSAVGADGIDENLSYSVLLILHAD